MHEVSLAEEILRIVETSSIEERFSKVQSLTLAIGGLAGVEAEALEFALTHMAHGTVLEGTKILLHPVSGSGYCDPCAVRVSIDSIHSPCPLCAHHPLTLIEGIELRVQSLDVI